MKKLLLILFVLLIAHAAQAQGAQLAWEASSNVTTAAEAQAQLALPMEAA